MPRVIKVIESETVRGAGVPAGKIKYRGGLAEHRVQIDDPIRSVRQYHTEAGEFLAEVDPRKEEIVDIFEKREQQSSEPDWTQIKLIAKDETGKDLGQTHLMAGMVWTIPIGTTEVKLGRVTD